MANKKSTKEDISFENRVERLQKIVESLEQGNVTLAESLILYKEGVEHSNLCRQELAKAQLEIQVLSQQIDNGSPEPGVSDNGDAIFDHYKTEWEEFKIEK